MKTVIDGAVIETRSLTKRFGQRTAVDRVDLVIPAGAAFGFLGPNGAGKTTLIRTLLGLTQPTSGEISLLGLPQPDRKSTRLNSSHSQISYAVFCLKKKRCTRRRISGLTESLLPPRTPADCTRSAAHSLSSPNASPTARLHHATRPLPMP